MSLKAYFQWKVLTSDGLLVEPESVNRPEIYFSVNNEFFDTEEAAKESLDKYFDLEGGNFHEYVLVKIYRA